MIVYVPTVKAESVIVACPLLKVSGEPKFVPSTANCTVPPLSKVPEPGVTVAVKVTVWPETAGLAEAVTAVVVARLVDVSPSRLLLLLLAAKIVSPL